MGPGLLSYTFMCPGEASPNKNIEQITKINELSAMRNEKPIILLF